MRVEGIERLRIYKEVDQLTFGATWRQTKLLLRDTFRRTSYDEEKLVIERILLTKGWILHTILMSTRVIWPIFGIAFWQTAYKKLKGNDRVNDEFAA